MEIREMTYLGEIVDLYLQDEKQTFYAQDISARIHVAGFKEGAKSGNRICNRRASAVSGRKGVRENETCNI